MTFLVRSYPSGECASFNFLAKIDGMIVEHWQVYRIRFRYSNPKPHGPTGINELALLFSFLKFPFFEKCQF